MSSSFTVRYRDVQVVSTATRLSPAIQLWFIYVLIFPQDRSIKHGSHSFNFPLPPETHKNRNLETVLGTHPSPNIHSSVAKLRFFFRLIHDKVQHKVPWKPSFCAYAPSDDAMWPVRSVDLNAWWRFSVCESEWMFSQKSFCPPPRRFCLWAVKFLHPDKNRCNSWTWSLCPGATEKKTTSSSKSCIMRS